MHNKYYLGSPAGWNKFPTFFRKPEKGENYNNSDLCNQEPCLASLRWLGRLPDLFRHQLVAGRLIFILLFPYSLSYSQELSWMSPRSWERATVAMAPAFSSHVIQIMERWSNLYTQLISQIHVTHL